ncbi:MAG: hemolysin family protein [Butyricicoccus sp.]|nr:hemolysin family protein [Butyricicoccus sp.]
MSFYIAAAVACVLLSAFFSAAEMSLSSANPLRLESLRDSGSKAAGLAVKLIESFDNTLSAILIGNNFVNIALSSLGSLIAITAFGEEYTPLATVIVTVTVIIFGETVPKIVAKKNANRLSSALAPFVRALAFLLFPLVWLVVKLVHLITAPMRGDGDMDGDAAVEELQSIIETAEDEDVIDEERSELLQAALDFDEVSASEVMTARVDMQAIDIDDDWGEIVRAIESTTFSRLPVYQDSVDNIIGVLYLNHFFKARLDGGAADLRALLMKPCFIYKTVKLPAVLEQLRQAKMHLAIVTDEYGGTLGLISMEDVLEQLVGEIWDETDEIEDEVVERDGGELELDGDMVIGDFLELIGRDEDEFETDSATVGGWTLEMFGAFPAEGEGFTAEGLEVTVLKMDGLRVERVLVKVLPEAAGE